jgi:hypothetical protein
MNWFWEIIKGMGSIFNLFPTVDYKPKSDYDALQSDWEAINKDFESVLKKYKND